MSQVPGHVARYGFSDLVMTTLYLNLTPVAWERARVGRFGHFTAPKSRKFKNEVQTLMRAQCRGEPYTKALSVKMTFYMGCPKRRPPKGAKNHVYPAVKPDIDNLQKQIMDCGNGILWEDDALIVRAEAEKIYDWAGRWIGITLEVEEL